MMVLAIIVGGEKSKGKILKKIHERMIKNFMDIIILAEPGTKPISGYDVISFIHNKFHLLVISGSVLLTLIFARKKRAKQRNMEPKKKSVQTTEKGMRTIEAILSANDKIKSFITSILRVQVTP